MFRNTFNAIQELFIYVFFHFHLKLPSWGSLEFTKRRLPKKFISLRVICAFMPTLNLLS